MTKKVRRRDAGLLAPRRPKRWKALPEDYGRHVLDATLQEIQPERRPPLCDEPGKRADHQLLTGPLIAYLEALIDTAMAHSGALNTDEEPEQVMREATGISHLEYEAVLLWAQGVNWAGIAREQKVTAEAAEVAGKSGVRKLQRFVRT